MGEVSLVGTNAPPIVPLQRLEVGAEVHPDFRQSVGHRLSSSWDIVLIPVGSVEILMKVKITSSRKEGQWTSGVTSGLGLPPAVQPYAIRSQCSWLANGLTGLFVPLDQLWIKLN